MGKCFWNFRKRTKQSSGKSLKLSSRIAIQGALPCFRVERLDEHKTPARQRENSSESTCLSLLTHSLVVVALDRLFGRMARVSLTWWLTEQASKITPCSAGHLQWQVWAGVGGAARRSEVVQRERCCAVERVEADSRAYLCSAKSQHGASLLLGRRAKRAFVRRRTEGKVISCKRRCCVTLQSLLALRPGFCAAQRAAENYQRARERGRRRRHAYSQTLSTRLPMLLPMLLRPGKDTLRVHKADIAVRLGGKRLERNGDSCHQRRRRDG